MSTTEKHKNGRRQSGKRQYLGGPAYERKRVAVAKRDRALSTDVRDIGECPPVADPVRRESCRLDLRLFCECYFPRLFYLPWSTEHIRAIAAIQDIILTGGTKAFAMPRGFGKTVLCEVACLWAVLHRHGLYVAILGPGSKHAGDRITSMRSELERNATLGADFPEVCYPIGRLEGISQRRLIWHGRPVVMKFSALKLVLPMLSDTREAGGVIEAAGLTGHFRGLNHRGDDGRAMRPSVALIDDPQTDESAHSPSQVAKLEQTILGAVLGLGGPDKPMAAVMPCTVIARDDLADRFLSHEKHPEWDGQRTRMVVTMPTDEDRWARYALLRREAKSAGDKTAAVATAFYVANQAAMDAGCVLTWPQKLYPGDVSPIQHAMNLRIDRGETAFWAEYQNEPLPDHASDDDIAPSAIAARVNGVPRGHVAGQFSRLTAFIDVQGKALYWVVAAWADDFTGAIVDYGTEPDQVAGYFTLSEIKNTLQRHAPRAGMEGAIYAGLTRLTDRLLGRTWRRDDGAELRIERCMVDANWGQTTDLVYDFCRASPFGAVLRPSRGKFVGAATLPMNEWKPQPGDRRGLNWRERIVAGKRAVRHIEFDANFWKTFLRGRLLTAVGDSGALTLFGRSADAHRMIADHLTAEFKVTTSGRGRQVDEWKLRKPGLDNHLLDCAVGAAVAASTLGVSLAGFTPTARRKVKRVSLAEMMGRR